MWKCREIFAISHHKNKDPPAGAFVLSFILRLSTNRLREWTASVLSYKFHSLGHKNKTTLRYVLFLRHSFVYL